MARVATWRAEFSWLRSTRNPQAVRAYVQLLARLTQSDCPGCVAPPRVSHAELFARKIPMSLLRVTAELRLRELTGQRRGRAA